MTDECTITDQREWVVERRKHACVVYECRPYENTTRTVVATWRPESGLTWEYEHEHLFPCEIRSRTARVCMRLWDQSSKSDEVGAAAEVQREADNWLHVAALTEMESTSNPLDVAKALRAQGVASALAAYPTGKELDRWRNVNDVPGFLFPAVDSNARSLDVFRSDLTGLLGLLIRDSDGNQIPDSGVAMGGRAVASLIGALIEIHGKMTEGDDD